MCSTPPLRPLTIPLAAQAALPPHRALPPLAAASPASSSFPPAGSRGPLLLCPQQMQARTRGPLGTVCLQSAHPPHRPSAAPLPPLPSKGDNLSLHRPRPRLHATDDLQEVNHFPRGGSYAFKIWNNVTGICSVPLVPEQVAAGQGACTGPLPSYSSKATSHWVPGSGTGCIRPDGEVAHLSRASHPAQ